MRNSTGTKSEKMVLICLTLSTSKVNSYICMSFTSFYRIDAQFLTNFTNLSYCPPLYSVWFVLLTDHSMQPLQGTRTAITGEIPSEY